MNGEGIRTRSCALFLAQDKIRNYLWPAIVSLYTPKEGLEQGTVHLKRANCLFSVHVWHRALDGVQDVAHMFWLKHRHRQALQ
jgi:hypothetical protein